MSQNISNIILRNPDDKVSKDQFFHILQVANGASEDGNIGEIFAVS